MAARIPLRRVQHARRRHPVGLLQNGLLQHVLHIVINAVGRHAVGPVHESREGQIRERHVGLRRHLNQPALLLAMPRPGFDVVVTVGRHRLPRKARVFGSVGSRFCPQLHRIHAGVRLGRQQ